MTEGAEVVDLADFGASRQSIWRMGYRGDDAELFQRRLIGHGFTRLAVTGVIDLETAGAVRVLQKHLGLHVDGVITPELRAALDADEAQGAPRAKAAGAEFTLPVRPMGRAAAGTLGDMSGGTGLAATESPQNIQVIEAAAPPVPFYKNPMVWLGVGGAALLIYIFTREEKMSDSGGMGLESLADEGDDPEEFFSAPRKRRAPTRRKKKPAAKRKPRRKKADALAAVDDVPKPRKRRRKKALGDTELGPDGETTPDPHAGVPDNEVLDSDDEAGVAGNPPKPRRRRKKAAGK